MRRLRSPPAGGEAFSVEKCGLPPADFAICVNVLISPEPVTRDAILQNIAAALLPGAHLVLVVPAVKSAQLQRHAYPKWLEERRRLRLRAKPVFDPCEKSCASDEAAGVYRREGVRTKHFREAEMKKLLKRAGFDEVLDIKRVEYGWHTEFPDALEGLEQQLTERPHDMLVVARRAGGRSRAPSPTGPPTGAREDEGLAFSDRPWEGRR